MSDLTDHELQIKLAFLERHIEEQDKVMHAMRREIAALREEIRRIGERLDAAATTSSKHDVDERPPHY